MILFLTIAISLYTAAHAVVFWGLYPLLAGWRAAIYSVLFWMALMIIAPIATQLLDASGSHRAARLLALAGYSWMGLLFLGFCMFSVVGLAELCCRLLGALTSWPRYSLHLPLTAAAVLLLTITTGLYGCHEAKNIGVEKISINTDRLGPRLNHLRLVQISDLHLGLIHRSHFLVPVINQLKQLQPDLLVVTGDLLDARVIHLLGLDRVWQEIQPPLGKYAVIGNHEVYAGLGQSIDFLRQCGFTVLRNTGITIDGAVNLIGMDDEAVPGPRVDVDGLLKSHTSPLFTIFLKHRPTVTSLSPGFFDLQLSGHAHRGQIFPFNYVTGREYPMQDGLYRLTPRGTLYTSRGTGTWGPPMRVLSPPEITVFEISGGNP